MTKTDVLIIGGSAAGFVVAVTGKTAYPEKDFFLIRKEEKVMVPCGIPYIFGSLESSDQNIMPGDVMYDKLNIQHKVGEVIEIDKNQKICKTKDGEEIQYNKLVLATGSTPKSPKSLVKDDYENVHVIPKNKEYLDKLAEQLDGEKKS